MGGCKLLKELCVPPPHPLCRGLPRPVRAATASAAPSAQLGLSTSLSTQPAFLRSDLGQNQLVMLAPELGGCAKLTILDISGNAITAAAIPPGLFKTTQLARLWRDGCPIAEAELSALDGFAEFQQREAAREAKKLDQRRGETGDVMFVEQKGGGASQQNMHS